MLGLVRRSAAVLALVVGFAGVMRAQLPHDNDVWKKRCSLLDQNSAQILNGTAPAMLEQGTRGISGDKFAGLAIDRAQTAQPAVSCVLYYMSVMAYQQRNAGTTLPPRVLANYAATAHVEYKIMTHQKIKMRDKMKREEVKMRMLRHPLNLSEQDTLAVVTASDTMPITMNVAQNVAPPAPAVRRATSPAAR